MKTPGLIPCLLLSLASITGAAEFTVTNASNGGPGSLRHAILDANASPNVGGQDRIIFNIPSPGVHIIDVSGLTLPEITDPVIIDGYSQPGARPNTLAVGNDAVILVQIDSTTQSSAQTGLHISAGTSIVRGLSITGFRFGVNSHGINLTTPGAASIIEGNFIGLSPDGQTARRNYIGINLATRDNRVGGTTPAARNVIAGDNLPAGTGIRVRSGPNTIQGNYIGTDASGGRALSDPVGILAEGPLNGTVIIGGTGDGAGNVVTGNSSPIQLGNFASFLGNIVYLPANGVEVSGNLIGVASNGATRFGNNPYGIHILVSSNTLVGGMDPGAGNVIAFKNAGSGVFLDDFGTGPLPLNNKILSNSIFGRGLGIALGREAPNRNDPMDPDEGENHLQNFPIVTSTSVAEGTMTIQGTFNSTPNTQFTIQLFADSNNLLQPGQAFLGTTTVTTDTNGNASFTAAVPAPTGHVTINATATDPAGNTSEFFLRPSHLRNLSTRARIQPGEAVLIGGLIIQGEFSVLPEIIVRAIGPSLSGAGVSGQLEDPTLEIYAEGMLAASNDNWRDDPATAAKLEAHGLAPANELEAAVVIRPGVQPYTAIVRGKNNSGGIGLVEFYDVTGANRRPGNLSSRGLVEPGDNVLIGGFILLDGYGPTRVVIRGIGPSLAGAGIASPLPDPTLELHDGNGATLASNDNWQDSQEAEIRASHLQLANPAEAAIYALLSPGTYTAVLRGKGTSTGIALVEFYQLP